MAQKKVNAVIHSQEKLAEGIYSMWLDAPEMAEAAVPGQFIAVYTNDQSKLLPRPISICEADKENGRLRIVYRIAGAGTKEFSAYKAGDTLDIMGPLGNGFPLKKKKAFLIGGGIGIPPMLELAKNLDCEKTAVIGYRDQRDFPSRRASQIRRCRDRDGGRKRRNEGKCHRCDPRGEAYCGYYLRLRTDPDVKGIKSLCNGERHRMLHLPGREDGVRDWCLSWLRLPQQGR